MVFHRYVFVFTEEQLWFFTGVIFGFSVGVSRKISWSEYFFVFTFWEFSRNLYGYFWFTGTFSAFFQRLVVFFYAGKKQPGKGYSLVHMKLGEKVVVRVINALIWCKTINNKKSENKPHPQINFQFSFQTLKLVPNSLNVNNRGTTVMTDC